MTPQILRGLGAEPAATAADGLPGILGAVAAGSLLAVAVAVGLSPLTLFGPVRAAEPSAGIYLDTAVLGLGALFLFVVLGRGGRRHRLPAGAAPRGRPRAAGRPRVGRGPGRAGRRAAGASGGGYCGSPWSLGTGRTAVPVRSVITGAVLAIGVVMATLTFGASLRYAGIPPGPVRLELQLRAVLDRRVGAVPPADCPAAAP